MSELKQPQLGESIVALRQKKKMTQEELVELCNINVRTLQRIESGDVTPRDYTMRAILSALDYDFDRIESSLDKKKSIGLLNIAWIMGIVYFLFGFIETGVDFARFESGLPFYFPLIYTIVKVVVMLSFAYFMLGFADIGKHHENSLLKISAYLMMGSMFIIEIYDIISIFSGITDEEFLFIKGSEAIAFGAINILFGVSLFKLSKQVGDVAKLAGLFEILVGSFFLTFFFSFVGLFFMIPAVLLEIIVLYKVYDKLKLAK